MCCCVCVCVSVCGVVCAVWCGTLKPPVCRLKTPPCVHSKRARVCRQHAYTLFNMCAWCRHTRGRFERYTRWRVGIHIRVFPLFQRVAHQTHTPRPPTTPHRTHTHTHHRHHMHSHTHNTTQHNTTRRQKKTRQED